jgi:DNA-binding PadR family transcriptional regulator
MAKLTLTREQLLKMAAKAGGETPPILVSHPLADIQAAVLAALAQLSPDATAARVRQLLVDEVGEDVDQTQIHSAFSRMQENHNYIEAQAEVLRVPGKKATTRYAITAKGREAITSKIAHLRQLADVLEKLQAVPVADTKKKRAGADGNPV